MAREIKPGTPVQVMFREEGEPQQANGLVAAVGGAMLALRFDDPLALDEGREVVLVLGTARPHPVATAEVLQCRAGTVVFRLRGTWQVFNAREHPRFAADIKVDVRSVLGRLRQPGTLIDVSLGGMAVLVATKPAGNVVELGIMAGSYSATVMCRIVEAVPLGSGVRLRLTIDRHTGQVQAFMRHLVAAVAAAEAEREDAAS